MDSTDFAHKVRSLIDERVLFVFIWLWNFFALSYISMGFIFMDYRKYNVIHGAFGHILHYLIPGGILVAMLLPKQRKPKMAATSTEEVTA